MSRVERWERRTEIPLLVLALAFLVAYAWPILDPSIDRTVAESLSVLSWAVWGGFLLDFLVRLGLASDRLQYAVRHWYDVALVLLPMLRPLRLLRALALARILSRVFSHNRAGRVTFYVGGATLATIGLGGLAVLDAERGHPESNIGSFGDALWWATTTATTVGYGDRFPVTTEGRIVALLLMIVGIALIGSITAAIASWFVSSTSQVDDVSVRAENRPDHANAAILASLTDLKQQVAELEARLQRET